MEYSRIPLIQNLNDANTMITSLTINIIKTVFKTAKQILTDRPMLNIDCIKLHFLTQINFIQTGPHTSRMASIDNVTGRQFDFDHKNTWTVIMFEL